MEIELIARYGYYLKVVADNVHIEEDIESRTYPKDADGKTGYSNSTRDVDTKYVDMISRVLDDMVSYRIAEYDSSTLISTLFEKLPEEQIIKLMKKLNKDYDYEDK
jgi:hypothetical protein